MCLAPNKLDDGKLVACRSCKLCRQNEIKDWAGRCIAESKTSRYTYYVTLTYGRDEYGDSDHLNAAVLTYSDVQKYLKRVRKTVGKYKYFCAGEYGTDKGRAHWHLLLFTQKPLADHVKMRTRYIEEHWEWGWSYFEPFEVKHAYYCAKYVYKDKHEPLTTAMHRMSKKPPLGTEFFRQLADRQIVDGIAPQDLFYSHAESRRKNGELIQYKLGGKSAENYLEYFVEQWQRVYGKSELDYYDVRFNTEFKQVRGVRRIPQSEIVQEYLDKRMRRWIERAETWQAHWAYMDLKSDREKKYEQEKKARARKDDCACASCVSRRQAYADRHRGAA